MKEQIKITTKGNNDNHLNNVANFCGCTIRWKILIFLAVIFIVTMDVIIALRMWNRIEISLKVWNIMDIIFLFIFLMGVFAEALAYLRMSFRFMMFSFFIFSINATIQGVMDIQKYAKDHADNQNKSEKIMFVSLVVIIILSGMIIRLWMLDHTSKAIDTMGGLRISFKPHHNHHYHHNDKAKMTFREIKPKFKEAPDPDISIV